MRVDAAAQAVGAASVRIDWSVFASEAQINEEIDIYLDEITPTIEKKSSILGSVQSQGLASDSKVISLAIEGPYVFHVSAKGKSGTFYGESAALYVKYVDKYVSILSRESFEQFADEYFENQKEERARAEAKLILDKADALGKKIGVSTYEGKEIRIPIADSRGTNQYFIHGSRFEKALQEIAKSDPKYSDNVEYYDVPEDYSKLTYNMAEGNSSNLRGLEEFTFDILAKVNFDVVTEPDGSIDDYYNCANMDMELWTTCYTEGTPFNPGTCIEEFTVDEDGDADSFEMWYAHGINSLAPFHSAKALTTNTAGVTLGKCEDGKEEVECDWDYDIFPVFKNDAGDDEAFLDGRGSPSDTSTLYNEFVQNLSPPGPTKEWNVWAEYRNYDTDSKVNPLYCIVFPTLMKTRNTWYDASHSTYVEFDACAYNSEGLLYFPACGSGSSKITFESYATGAVDCSQHPTECPWYVIHEAGHYFHYKLQNGDWDTPDSHDSDVCETSHTPFTDYTEGFADMFAARTWGSSFVSFIISSGEMHTSCTPSSSQSEGINAEFIWDLFDNVNDSTYDGSLDAVYAGNATTQIYEWAGIDCNNISCFINAGKDGGPLEGYEDEVCELQCYHELDDAAGLDPTCTCDAYCNCTSN